MDAPLPDKTAGPDWIEEYDAPMIRELAARPEFIGISTE